MKIPKRIIFRVRSISRSGHHAIAIWINECCKLTVYDYKFGRISGSSVFLAGIEKLNQPGSLLHMNPRAYLKKLKYSKKNRKRNSQLNRNQIDNSRYIIYNMDNYDFSKSLDKGIKKSLNILNLPSYFNFDIYVIRDPFNLFASQILTIKRKKREKRTLKKSYKIWNKDKKKRISTYKKYLRFFIKNNTNPSIVVVNFNKWFVSIKYRKKLAVKLSIPFTDNGLNTVSGYGGGSSVNGTKYDGRAGNMKVLDRWLKLIYDDEFVRIFNDDKEFLDLLSKVYPKETKSFLDLISSSDYKKKKRKRDEEKNKKNKRDKKKKRKRDEEKNKKNKRDMKRKKALETRLRRKKSTIRSQKKFMGAKGNLNILNLKNLKQR